MIGLDRFKQVNALQGHRSGGCAAARRFAAAGHVLSESEPLARMGGDEFVAILNAAEGPWPATYELRPVAYHLIGVNNKAYADLVEAAVRIGDDDGADWALAELTVKSDGERHAPGARCARSVPGPRGVRRHR